MAKKIKGADGKEYKVKKPIYKRVWFWILIVIIVAGIGSALGGNKGDDETASDKTETEKSSSKSTESKASSSSKADSGKITRAQFDAVKVGDLFKEGEGGQTTEEIEKLFGKPSSTSSSTTENVKTDLLTWTNVEGGFGANIVIGFTNNKVFSKDLTGFKVNRKNKITLADFESIANGTSYNDVISKFGEPDGLTESMINGDKNVVAMYLTGVKGSLGANFNITFDNDVVSGKSQSSMEN
ncbi:DUF3862 domain-containing protein [Lapidilactobacillus luobeiensis]|uniref:DUF3862 domain-containing protein n=1 Tax=Lapidilactobacillus luobeiensis TaxID=2950371 RepID=UPI0021C3132C|nr:DUF3862 domain-containing protein [Lapidilactobacillus luobeiensis]